MQTFNDGEVWETLRAVARRCYPDKLGLIKDTKVTVYAAEHPNRHGDYDLITREIRIFNLSRPKAAIIKTTVHELAHHLDFCFYGSTCHNKRFFVVYKCLLETAHRMRVVNLAEANDPILNHDITRLEAKVGRLEYKPFEPSNDFIVKVRIPSKDRIMLVDRGYRLSEKEQCWIREFTIEELAEEVRWLRASVPEDRVIIVRADENVIDAVYLGVIGKDKRLFEKRDELMLAGFRRDPVRGWYKKIRASQKEQFEQAVKHEYGVTKVRFVAEL